MVVAEPDQRDTLISQIRSQLATLRRFSQGYNKNLVSSAFLSYSVVKKL